jgi:ATP-dependent helicase/nuclease subunit A
MECAVSSATSELGNIILRAGAGAGKTTTLTHLFLDYAAAFNDRHQRFPRIVVTTFTRKATQELKERLLLLALEKNRQDLFHYVTNKSQVQISTIHGVLSLFLGRYGNKLGLSSDFKLLSGPQETSMRRKILRRLILGEAQFETLLESYSFRQLEEALQSYFEKSFLFSDYRFVTKEEFEADLQRHLATLESERKSVSAMILAETQQASWTKYGEALQGFSLPTALENLRNFFVDNPRRPSFSSKNPAVSTETNDRLVELITALKDLLESPERTPAYWEEHENKNKVFEELAQAYSMELFQTKMTTGSITMSDLELMSLKLVREFPEASEAFSQEWDYWMIDEYQDTSPIQVALLKALVGERKSFVVGDPQQSIYLFRGARSEVFQDKIVEFHENGGQVQEKLINYRSTPRLLHFINSYFLKCSDQFAAMEPAPGKDRGSLEKPVAQLRMVEKAENLTGLSEEVQSGLQRIQELLNQGVNAEKICVLSRTRDSLENLAKAAEAYGVPVQIHVAGGFYRRREVQDTLCLLKFLINPHDNINFLSCLRSPWLQVPDQELLSYCHSQSHSFWSEALKTCSDKDERHPILLLKKYLQQSQGFGYSFVLRKMLVELGFLDYVHKLDPTGRREANLWKLISTLFQEERRPGINLLDFLSGLQETPDLESSHEDSDATPVIAPRRVNLMTVHASKGLQFDHVLLLGMAKKPRLSQAELFSVEEETGRWSLSLMNEEERKLQPSSLALDVRKKFNQRELQEHLRVLYVALTRAKEGLTLLWAGKPEKNSWAESCPLNLNVGAHAEKEFSYEVLTGSFEPQVQNHEEIEYQKDPGPWKKEVHTETHQTMAVTKLVASEMESASKSSSIPATLLQKALAKAYRGTEAHRIFESLKYSDIDTVVSHLEDDELKNAVHFIANTKDIPLLKVIQDGHVEWGFSFKEKDFWIQGQIDLWGAVNDEIWIVDYKTGSSDYAATAFGQLKAYAWALAKMGFIPDAAKVHLAVVYPFEKKIKTESDHQIELEKALIPET